MMAKSAEVQQAAKDYLPYMVASPILGCACFMLDGIFIGATRGADMRNMMMISLMIYVGSVLALTPTLGNHGLSDQFIFTTAASSGVSITNRL